MHTFHGQTVSIKFNGDYSGNLIIHRDGNSIEVLSEDIFVFVAEFVINKRIEELEKLAYEGWEAILK